MDNPTVGESLRGNSFLNSYRDWAIPRNFAESTPMNRAYDKYYQTEDLFGQPYPELITFFENLPQKGKVLDLGCGQGRDAISLARLGFEVRGLDNSEVGIQQMIRVAEKEKLPLTGSVEDIFAFEGFDAYDFVLLDSMFHFEKRDKAKEIAFIEKILTGARAGCQVVFCIQDSGKKVEILNGVIDSFNDLERMAEESFDYLYEDRESGHHSKMKYKMIVVRK